MRLASAIIGATAVTAITARGGLTSGGPATARISKRLRRPASPSLSALRHRSDQPRARPGGTVTFSLLILLGVLCRHHCAAPAGLHPGVGRLIKQLSSPLPGGQRLPLR